MTWFYLAILSTFGTAISNIYRRVAMKDNKSDAVAIAIAFQFIGAVVIGTFAFIHGFAIPPIAQYPINYLLQAVAWSIATVSLFKTSEQLEASQTAIITTGASIVTIITALFFLHEHFNGIFLIGTILIIFSIIFAFYQKGKMIINRGILYALSYCLFAGIGTTNDVFNLRHAPDTLSWLAIGFLAPGILLFLTHPKIIFKMNTVFNRSMFPKIFITSFFYSTAGIMYFFAVRVGGQISQVYPINQSAIILTVLFATIFLHERTHVPKKILCAILVAAGVLLLS